MIHSADSVTSGDDTIEMLQIEFHSDDDQVPNIIQSTFLDDESTIPMRELESPLAQRSVKMLQTVVDKQALEIKELKAQISTLSNQVEHLKILVTDTIPTAAAGNQAVKVTEQQVLDAAQKLQAASKCEKRVIIWGRFPKDTQPQLRAKSLLSSLAVPNPSASSWLVSKKSSLILGLIIEFNSPAPVQDVLANAHSIKRGCNLVRGVSQDVPLHVREQRKKQKVDPKLIARPVVRLSPLGPSLSLTKRVGQETVTEEAVASQSVTSITATEFTAAVLAADKGSSLIENCVPSKLKPSSIQYSFKPNSVGLLGNPCIPPGTSSKTTRSPVKSLRPKARREKLDLPVYYPIQNAPESVPPFISSHFWHHTPPRPPSLVRNMPLNKFQQLPQETASQMYLPPPFVEKPLRPMDLVLPLLKLLVNEL